MMPCPCGSNVDFINCCNRYLENTAIPETPEALMRSRYCAYTRTNMDYIRQTMRGKALALFNEQETAQSSQSVKWLHLNVVSSSVEDENSGFVEFLASYLHKNVVKTIHEISEFEKINNCWFYTDGKQITEPAITISRNAPCPCGSKRKFKNCHGHE